MRIVTRFLCRQPLLRTSPPPRIILRLMSTTPPMAHKIKPAARVDGQRKDVWSIVNEAAAAATKERPVVNLGQGFFVRWDDNTFVGETGRG